MAVVADWHGRVTVRRMNLRGQIPAACTLLKTTLSSFDRREASRPPYRMPDWAEPPVGKRGPEAFASLLGKIHGSKKRRFDDVVAVYRLDRLSRSLLDFANLMEVFQAHGVSFVSVTEHFETSTPMGRMVLNMLATFAQFERETIAERTRSSGSR